MSELIPGNQKHLTLNDRKYIEASLNQGMSFKDIARFLCKDPTTISKEIRLHRATNTWNRGSFTFHPKNLCAHRFRCKKVNVCEKLIPCDQKCSSCYRCNQKCKRFELQRCSHLERAPYVCNGCETPRNRCTIINKYDYNAAFAQRKYEELRSSSRQGINKTRKQLMQMNRVIIPLIQNGQSPYAIVANHPELDTSVRSLYSYIDQGILGPKNIDLKRKVKMKPRKKQNSSIRDRAVFTGRTYTDFKALSLDDSGFVEMDTVVSAKGSSKCILTFYFPDTHLFLAYLLNRGTTGAVRAVFDRLEKTLGTYEFHCFFPVILTDRGSEFGDPESLENGADQFQRTDIYYCDPMRSCQKGGIEEAHTLLRMVLPKKTVFTDLTQWDLRKIVNHINSYPRQCLNGSTPYKEALAKYGADLLKEMQLKPIAPDEVTLTPKLLKK